MMKNYLAQNISTEVSLPPEGPPEGDPDLWACPLPECKERGMRLLWGERWQRVRSWTRHSSLQKSRASVAYAVAALGGQGQEGED